MAIPGPRREARPGDRPAQPGDDGDYTQLEFCARVRERPVCYSAGRSCFWEDAKLQRRAGDLGHRIVVVICYPDARAVENDASGVVSDHTSPSTHGSGYVCASARSG